MALAGEAMVVLQSDDLPIYDAPTQRFVAEMVAGDDAAFRCGA